MFASILKNIKSNILSYVFVCLGIILSVAVAIVYNATGVTAFNPKLNPTIIILSLVAGGIGLVTFALGFKTCKYLAFVAGLAAFLAYVREEITYIANIFTGIDGTSFSASFILTFAMSLLAFIFFLIAGITQKERLGVKSIQEGN